MVTDTPCMVVFRVLVSSHMCVLWLLFPVWGCIQLVSPVRCVLIWFGCGSSCPVLLVGPVCVCVRISVLVGRHCLFMCVDWGVGFWVGGYYSTHMLWPSLLGCPLMRCWWHYHWMLLIPVIPDVLALLLHYATTGFCVCRDTGCLFTCLLLAGMGVLGSNCFLNGLVVVMVGGAAFSGLCQKPCWG
jgi:hypothetical protein